MKKLSYHQESVQQSLELVLAIPVFQIIKKTTIEDEMHDESVAMVVSRWNGPTFCFLHLMDQTFDNEKLRQSNFFS